MRPKRKRNEDAAGGYLYRTERNGTCDCAREYWQAHAKWSNFSRASANTYLSNAGDCYRRGFRVLRRVFCHCPPELVTAQWPAAGVIAELM